MIVPALRLECDGLDTLDLSEFGVSYVDLGDPEVRAVAEYSPDANGTVDTTAYFGARPVALNILMQPESGSVWSTRSRLRAFTRPDLRPKLFVQFDGEEELMLTLRASQWSEPWDVSGMASGAWWAQVQWVCPSGLIESADLQSVSASAGGEEAQSGLTFDATPDFSFGGATQASGGALATNDGNVPVWPIVTMYGPFSAGTILLNDTTGQQLEFVSSMSIATGDWLQLDFAAKTIVNSTGTSYYDSLDFASSEWWQLAPGENRIFMLPTTFTAPPAGLLVEWRDGWL